METPASIEKLGNEQEVTYASSLNGEVGFAQKQGLAYLKHYFTTREGWLGEYVSVPRRSSVPTFPSTLNPHFNPPYDQVF
jgi:hypothetical protein